MAGTAGSFLQDGAPTHARTLRDSPKDKRPFTEMLHDEKVPGSGLLLVGEKALFFFENDYGAKHVLLPGEQFEGVKDCGFDQFPVSVGPSGWPGSSPAIPATLARPGSDPAPDPKKPEKFLPRVGGRNFKEFVEAIKSNEPSKTMSNLD
ncbi:MAG: hypothetical protein ACM35G_01910 [Planctomycetaceae bacterium]